MDIFIADDHPLIISVYENMIREDKPHFACPQILTASHCSEAYQNLYRAHASGRTFNLAVLDYNMPPYPDKNIYCGADLIAIIRKLFQDCKILLITAHTEVLLLYDALKRYRPEGMALKPEVSPDNFTSILRAILAGESYISPGVMACKESISEKDALYDHLNREILSMLAMGFQVQQISERLSLTVSAVRKRVGRMRQQFQVADEKSLIREANKLHVYKF